MATDHSQRARTQTQTSMQDANVSQRASVRAQDANVSQHTSARPQDTNPHGPNPPASQRTRNTMRNMVWGMVRRAVALLGPFVVRMLLIQRLGADYLGLSTFFTSLLQVLNLAELGFSSAVSYGMYAPIAQGDERKVAQHLVYLQRVYRFIGLAIVLLGALLIPALNTLVHGQVPANVNLIVAYAIYVANTAVGYFLYAHKQTLLIAHQRKDVVDRIGAVVLLVQFIVQAVLLVASPNFYTYALVLPATTIAGNVVLAQAANKLYPQYRQAAAHAGALSASNRAAMRKRIAGLVLQKAAILTRDPFATVVVSAMAGLVTVGSFGNYLMVVSGVLGILGVVASSMTAAVGNSIATESVKKNFNDLRLFVFLYACISIVCAAVVLALYQPFMQLWAGPDLVLPFGFAVVMVAYFYIRTMGDIRTVYVDATGVWWDLRWRALAETAANIVLAVVFTRLWGVYGAALALATSLFLFNFLYGSHLIFKLYFGIQNARWYYQDHAIYAAVGVATCAITFCISQLIPSGGVALLVLKGVVVAACAAIIIAIVFLRTKRYKQAETFLHRLVQK